MISRDLSIGRALRARQRGFLLNPFRFGGGGGGGGGDPYFANVSLLLHGDGSSGSTAIIDSSANGFTPTVGGNAQINTATKKYGTGSIAFDGSGDYLQYASAAAFGFGAGNWTVEGWAFMNVVQSGNYRSIFDNRGGGSEGVGIVVDGTDSNSSRRLHVANNAAVIGSSAVVFAAATWYHIAVVRQGNTLRGYVDGVQVFTATDSRTYASSAPATIGINQDLSVQAFDGKLDELRITKGVCRYPDGTTFTPPAAAFPNS